MSYILWGLGFVAAGFIIGLVYNIVKATKDPDVIAASDMHMSITNYRKYKHLYDANWAIMMKYGPNSRQAEEFFKAKIWPQIKNPNEWRRYQDYRAALQQKEMMDEIRGNYK